MIQNSLIELARYIEQQEFQGYDPYDTLNSWIPFKFLGKWPAAIATQIQKRNPINIRPLLGIKKGYNPKGMGLLLQAYSVIYRKNKSNETKEKMNFLFNWLCENYSQGYSGYCWGYNFDWVNPGGYLKVYTPSVVVAAFVIAGIHEYYLAIPDERAREIILNSSKYVLKDLPISEFKEGISFAYTGQSKGCCYNASLLGAELLSRVYSINRDENLLPYIKKALDYVISKQKDNGKWDYSYDKEIKKEREQIDFHQGFVLCSIDKIIQYVGLDQKQYIKNLEKGAEFYYKEQFFYEGRSKWRLPKVWPVDIHNQAQGIITFLQLSYLNSEYKNFATKIADWTIKNMQDKKGFFYYQKHKFYTNKISYMRWSQAWMMLALTRLQLSNNE